MTQTPANALPTIYETATDTDHFISPWRRRVGAQGLVTEPSGAVLMFEMAPIPEMEKHLYVPGGCTEGNENRRAAMARCGHARLGVTFTPGRLLVDHHMFREEHPTHVSEEGLNFVYDCGELPAETKFTLGGGAIGYRWLQPSELEEHLAPFLAERMLSALWARKTGKVVELIGHPSS